MPKPGIALLSAYRKDFALAEFANRLVGLDWRLLASSGTKKFLDEHKVPSVDIAEMVGPPILGHRVVTLDRRVYASILARLDNGEDVAELKRIGVESIDLVYVDLYPLAEELAKPNRTRESVREKIDIGGPTLLRATGKGERYILSNPFHFDPVLERLATPGEPDPDEHIRFLAGLASDAEFVVSDYASLAGSFYRSVQNGTFSEGQVKQSAA